MRFLVTGGAGFIGSNFVAKLMSENLGQVLVLDKLTYAGHLATLRRWEGHAGFRFVQGDIGDRLTVRRLLADFTPDAVVNFAAESHVDRSIDSAEEFIATNVAGSYALIDETLTYWQSLDDARSKAFRFQHVSTDEVYGSLGATGEFTETTPYAPNSPYAASKAAADHFVRAYHATHGLPITITNCSNNYGPYQFPEKLIPLALLNALEGKPVPVYGDGLNIRDWLYVGDHCQAILQVINQGRTGETYNVGGNTERTNLDLLQALFAALKDERELIAQAGTFDTGIDYAGLITFVADRPGHDRRYAIDSGKLRSETGWEPVEDLVSGLRKTVRWYLSNLDWCREVTEDNYNRQRLGFGEQASG